MPELDDLYKSINDKSAVIGILGLGYVGLPLAEAFAKAGFKIVGFDTDATKIEALLQGKAYLSHMDFSFIFDLVKSKQIAPTADEVQLNNCDVFIVCVPTPITETKEPDLTYVTEATKIAARHFYKGNMFILESTTYPGTTREIVKPLLCQKDNLEPGKNISIAFSPEREDPGNPVFKLKNTPKIVGGITDKCTELAVSLYSSICNDVVEVSTTEVAEMTKVFENIYRSVNIALVNELKLICHKMGINVREVIKAASSKPFGYQPFYPGPGVGGHCIRPDPYYLAWAARKFGIQMHFIELAGEVNDKMPEYVFSRVQEALNLDKKSINGSNILILGVAYKKNVGDVRESPAVKVAKLIQHAQANVYWHDPYVTNTDLLPGCNRVNSEGDMDLSKVDCVVILTDHDVICYSVYTNANLRIVDSRGVISTEYKKLITA